MTAKFVADFSSFTKAVDSAEVELKSFETSASKVGTALNRMADNFSGRKLIQEATLMAQAVEKIGGPSKLTASELQRVATHASEAAAKMRALGIDVPPKIKALADQATPIPGIFTSMKTAVTAVGGALGLAFTGTAILNGLKNQALAAVDYADSLSNLSASTSISVQGLQRLEAIGVTSGVSLQTLATAVESLQRHLDDPGAQRALRQMGLDYAEIRRLAPEDQFLKLASSVAAIKDPVDRMNAGTAIFGRQWVLIAAAIKPNMQEIIDQTTRMSDEQVAALDAAGDAWDTWKLDTTRTIRGFLGELVIADKKFQDANWAWEKQPKPFVLPKVVGPNNRNGGPSRNDVIDPTMISQLKVYGKTIEDTERAIKAQEKAEREATKTRQEFLDMSKAGLGPLHTWQTEILLTKFKADQLAVSETQLTEKVADLADFISSHKGEMFPEPPPGSLEEWKRAQQAIEKIKPASKDVTDHILKLAEGFADLAQISDGALGRVAKDVGQLVAALRVADDAGKAMKDGFKGGTQGLAQLAAGALSAAGALDAATNSVSKTKNVMSGAATGAKAGASAFGVYGAAIGAVAGALVGLAKSNTLEARTVSPLRDEFFKMAGGLERLNPLVQQLTGNLGLVQAVFDARNVEQYNKAIKDLNDLFALQVTALADVEETAKKYGLTIEEMGPAWARQQLDKKAQELFKDYQILVSAGVDNVLVIQKMSGAINEYVKNALKMGIEVPAAMKPMLEEMVKNGQLLDANGVKIEDLEKSGISFSMTMTEGFQALIKEVQKLTDIIARSLGNAIKNIPDGDFDIYGRYHPPKDQPPKDNDVDGSNAIPMAMGGSGRVTKPTLFLAGEAGPENFWFGGANQGGGGGSQVIQVVMPDGRVLAEVVNRQNDGRYRGRKKLRAA